MHALYNYVMNACSDQLEVKSNGFIIGGGVSSILEAKPRVSLLGAYAAVVVSLGACAR